MRYTKYLPIYERKVRGLEDKAIIESKEELIGKAYNLFNRLKKRKHIKEAAAGLPDTTIRVDLVNPPELSFIITIENGKLKFTKDRLYTNVAVGIHKELFSEIINNPRKFNVGLVLNNIHLRKGTVRHILLLRPLLIKVLFGLGMKTK